jgi:hypothetical protein
MKSGLAVSGATKGIKELSLSGRTHLLILRNGDVPVLLSPNDAR